MSYDAPVPTPWKLLDSLLGALIDRDPAALDAAHDRLLTWCSGYWAGVSRLAPPSQVFLVDESTPIPRELLDALIDAFEGWHGDGIDRAPAALDDVLDRLLTHLKPLGELGD